MGTVFILGHSKQADGVASILKRHISESYTEVNVEDDNACKVIRSAKTLIFIIPAYKEPYQSFRKLILALKMQAIDQKKIIFISTNGSVVHHGVMQMWIRDLGRLLASTHFPENQLCMKANGELVESEKVLKKIRTISHQLHIENNVKVVS